MRGSLFYSGAAFLLIFAPLTLWAVTYEDVQTTSTGYRITTVNPAAQALFAFLALFGFVMLIAGAVMEKPQDPKKDLTFNQWLLGRYVANRLENPRSPKPSPPHFNPGQRLFCPSCGAHDHGTVFCPYCGARLR